MATVDDKALVMVISKIEAGETLYECWRLWSLWGLTGVAPEASALWEAVGRAIGMIEDALGVNALECVEGSDGDRRVREVLCSPLPVADRLPGGVVIDLRGDDWQQKIVDVLEEVA